MAERLITGKEPNPTAGPVREFKFGPRCPYTNLQEIRDAMVEDDLTIIDNIANRRRRDALIVEELASYGAAVRPEDTARRVVPKELKRRYAFTRGLKGLEGLVEAVYVELAPESSSFQLYDIPIMHAIASRLEKVKFATLFKKTKAEGIAPAQQALNIARAAVDPLF